MKVVHSNHCSYGTSWSDLTRRRLSERLCHSEAMPYRTREMSAKLTACIELVMSFHLDG